MKEVLEVVKRIWLDGFYGSADQVIKFMDEIKDDLIKVKSSHKKVHVELDGNEYLVIYGLRNQNKEEIMAEEKIEAERLKKEALDALMESTMNKLSVGAE